MARTVPRLAALSLAGLLCCVQEDAKADGALMLEVVVNDHPLGQVGEFRQVSGTLLATRRELNELGFKTGPGEAEDLVPLASLQALSFRVDTAKQTLFATAATAALVPHQLGPDAGAGGPVAASGTGLVLNYDVSATRQGGRWLAGALFDARAYSPWGVLSSGGVVQSGLAQSGLGARSVRLDTTYTYSDPQSLTRVRVGDVISSGLAWTRPVRLGGAQVARDFSLRPDLVTIPVPSIAGQVAVPSTVDVMVNGVQQFSANAAPGPFEIRSLPVLTGANSVSVTIQNAAGVQSTQTLPIYTSQLLLAAGLDQFSLEAGAVRLGFGVRSDDYRDTAVSASYRGGVTDWLTLELHGEAVRNVANAGGGVAFAVADYGAVSLAASASRGHGVLGYAAVERISPTLSLSASLTWTNGGYRDIAALFGQSLPRRQIRAGIGVPAPGGGSLSLSYAYQSRVQTVTNRTLFDGTDTFGAFEVFVPPARTSLLAGSYTAPILDGRMFVYATAFHDFANRASSGALVGLTIPIGGNTSVSASAGVQGGRPAGSVEASRPVSAVGDFGGQALVTGGDGTRALVLGQYRSAVGQFELGADRVGAQTALRGRATGALVVADGGVFAGNAIADSFAVVDTDGTPGVQVSYENRPIERTGPSGRVLLPDLRSFEPNRVDIEPSDVPLDAEIGETTQIVRPPDRSGVVVTFPIRRSRAALLRLVDEGGQALKLGSRVRSPEGGADVLVGYDGEAFLHGLQPHGQVTVTGPDGTRCAAAYDYAPEPGRIPRIGPVACRRAAP